MSLAGTGCVARPARVGNESFQLAGPANKLVALYAAEDLPMFIEIVIHLVAGK